MSDREGVLLERVGIGIRWMDWVMLNDRLLTPGPMIVWWLDTRDRDDIVGWEGLFNRFLKEGCEFEVVEIEPETWPWIVVGAGVQAGKVEVPPWCRRVQCQMPWYGKEGKGLGRDDVIRWLAWSIPYIEYGHLWKLEKVEKVERVEKVENE